MVGLIIGISGSAILAAIFATLYTWNEFKKK